MTTFTFTDNRPLHKFVVTLTAAQLAEHLMKDAQFRFYWRKGWDPRLAATRSLYLNPPDANATVSPIITEEQWSQVEKALRQIKKDDMS